MSKTSEWFIELNRDLEENQVPYTMQNLGKPRYRDAEFLRLRRAEMLKLQHELARQEAVAKLMTIATFPAGAPLIEKD